MLKRRKPNHKAKNEDGGCSFGSGLDEVGWKPQPSSIRLKPRIEKTPAKVRISFEKALEAIAAEGRFGGPAHVSTELEMLKEATELVRQTRNNRD